MLMTMSLLDNNDLAEHEYQDTTPSPNTIKSDPTPPLRPVRNTEGIAWGACSSFDEEIYQNV